MDIIEEKNLRRKKQKQIWKKKFRANQKRLGLCVDCYTPVLPGRTRCFKHLQNDRIRKKRLVKEYRDLHNSRVRLQREKMRKEGKCLNTLFEDDSEVNFKKVKGKRKYCINCSTSYRYGREPVLRSREFFPSKGDVKSIRDCNLFIAFSDEGTSFSEPIRGRGRQVELGIALGLRKHCILIGKQEHLFHCLPEIVVYPFWENFLKDF